MSELAGRGVWQADPPPPEGWAVVYFKERGPARPERYYTYPPGNRSAIDADAWLWLPPLSESGAVISSPDPNDDKRKAIADELSHLLREEAWHGHWTPNDELNTAPLAEHTASVIVHALFADDRLRAVITNWPDSALGDATT